MKSLGRSLIDTWAPNAKRMLQICIGIYFPLSQNLKNPCIFKKKKNPGRVTSAARYQHNSTRQSPIRHRTSCHSSKRTPEGMNFPNQSLKNVLQLSTSFLPTTASGAAASPELSCLWENRPRHESKTAKRGRVCSQPPSVPRCSGSWESYQWLCGRTTKKTPPQTQGLEAGCSLAEIRRK